MIVTFVAAVVADNVAVSGVIGAVALGTTDLAAISEDAVHLPFERVAG